MMIHERAQRGDVAAVRLAVVSRKTDLKPAPVQKGAVTEEDEQHVFRLPLVRAAHLDLACATMREQRVPKSLRPARAACQNKEDKDGSNSKRRISQTCPPFVTNKKGRAAMTPRGPFSLSFVG
jgi:hypothetical protein